MAATKAAEISKAEIVVPSYEQYQDNSGRFRSGGVLASQPVRPEVKGGGGVGGQPPRGDRAAAIAPERRD
jgi:hypothetical protein